jgi:lysophospholipase L1-like esterase
MRPLVREAEELELPRPAGVYRIVLTGGSTAYGVGAPSDERTVGGYLESILDGARDASAPRVEVFTAASAGWASTHERIFIENQIADWQPNLVLALSGTNDIHFGAQGLDVLWFRSYSDELYWKLVDSAYRGSGRASLPDPTRVPDKRVAPELVAQRFVANARLAAAALRAVGARYVVALQPSLPLSSKALTPREERVRAELPAGAPAYFPAAHAAMLGALEREADAEFALLDLSDLFAARPAAEEIFLDNDHFGDRGNLAIAERLARELAARIASPARE